MFRYTTCEVFLWLDTCDVRGDIKVTHIITINQGHMLTLVFIDTKYSTVVYIVNHINFFREIIENLKQSFKIYLNR